MMAEINSRKIIVGDNGTKLAFLAMDRSKFGVVAFRSVSVEDSSLVSLKKGPKTGPKAYK